MRVDFAASASLLGLSFGVDGFVDGSGFRLTARTPAGGGRHVIRGSTWAPFCDAWWDIRFDANLTIQSANPNVSLSGSGDVHAGWCTIRIDLGITASATFNPTRLRATFRVADIPITIDIRL